MEASGRNWEGQWFRCYGWWVYPVSFESKVRFSIESNRDGYDDQPKWSFGQIKARDLDQAHEVVGEFVQAVRHASYEYCWPLSHALSKAQWQKHSWKHVTYNDLKLAAEDTVRPKIPEMRFHGFDIGSIRRLFVGAFEKNLSAVAFLTHLFPDENEKEAIAKSYLEGFSHAIDVDLKGIPSAGDLASDYVMEMYRDPNSREAEQAREKLEFLISPKSLKGQVRAAGRPYEVLHDESVAIVHRMSAALFRQIREMDRFLARFEVSEDARIPFLVEKLPWISGLRVQEEYDEPLRALLSKHPTEGAPFLAHLVLPHLSPSTIEKAAYKQRSPKRLLK